MADSDTDMDPNDDPWIETEDMIAKTPPGPDWGSFVKHIPQLGNIGRLQVAVPCTGISGASYAFEAMKIPADFINIWDLDARYAKHLEQHFLELGMDAADIILNLGKRRGDLLTLPLDKITTPVHILIAGPPCPPWASQGTHRSLKDARAQVFVRLLVWCFVLVHTGKLLGVVLENVPGILNRHYGREPTMAVFLRALRKFIPEMSWDVDTLKARDYGLPQSRKRVFLRGLLKRVLPYVPKVMPPFICNRRVDDLLGDFPATSRCLLTLPQQDNLEEYEQAIKDKYEKGKLHKDDIVCISVDRSLCNGFNTNMGVNVISTLQTGNRYLFVISVGCVVDDLPDEDRRFFRLLMPTERLTLQGFPPDVLRNLPTHTTCLKAAGNVHIPSTLII